MTTDGYHLPDVAGEEDVVCSTREAMLSLHRTLDSFLDGSALPNPDGVGQGDRFWSVGPGSVVFGPGAVAMRNENRSRTWFAHILKMMSTGAAAAPPGMSITQYGEGMYRLTADPAASPTAYKPVSGDPEFLEGEPGAVYLGEEIDPIQPSAGWDLAFGARINYGPDDTGTLRMDLHLSDQARAAGVVHRTVTPEQLIQHAVHLIRIATQGKS